MELTPDGDHRIHLDKINQVVSQVIGDVLDQKGQENDDADIPQNLSLRAVANDGF